MSETWFTTIRLPMTAENCTVLGRKVKPDSRTWTELDWSRVREDSGPHAFHPEQSGYLHVGADDKRWDMWYRVRCIYTMRDKIKVGGKRYPICRIWPKRDEEGNWYWEVGYKRAK